MTDQAPTIETGSYDAEREFYIFHSYRAGRVIKAGKYLTRHGIEWEYEADGIAAIEYLVEKDGSPGEETRHFSNTELQSLQAVREWLGY